jgi:predicted O-methyltransferase YrrM
MEHFYHLTEGEDWFTYPELYKAIVSAAPNKAHFVEVGVWKGRSAAYMAVEIINSKKIIQFDLVDTWEGSVEHQPLQEDVFEIFSKNIAPVSSYVNIKRMDSLSAAATYEDKSLDFVFIDAAHDYDNVKADINAWLPKVKQGGYLAGHDYPAWQGVKMAVDEIFGSENIQSNEGCWLYPVK